MGVSILPFYSKKTLWSCSGSQREASQREMGTSLTPSAVGGFILSGLGMDRYTVGEEEKAGNWGIRLKS